MKTPTRSRQPLDPRYRWLFRLVILVAVLLRLTYLLEATDAPDFTTPRFEAQYHDYWARALVSGDWTPPDGVTDPEIRQRPYFRPPGYPFFLAAVYRIFGTGYLQPRLVQMALGVLTCALLFGLGRRTFGDTAGLATAALMALYWVSLYFEAELMAPALLLFLLVLWTRQVERWQEGLTLWRALSAGGLLGLTAWVRPNVLLLAPVALLWLLWLRRRQWVTERSTFFRQTAVPSALFAAAVLLALLPVTLRNLIVADDAVLVTSNAGINLFVGSHPMSNGYNPGVPELGALLGDSGWDSFDQPKIVEAVAAEVGRPLKDSDVSRYFSSRAWQYMTSEPMAVLRLWGRKLLLFFGPAEISNTKVLAMEHRHSPTLGLGIGFATILALALLGAGLMAWRRDDGASDGVGARATAFLVFLLLCLGAFTVSYLPFFVSARFRLPMVPWLTLLGGAAVGIVWDGLARRRWGLVGGALLAFAGLRLVAGISWIPYQPDEALWHSRRGVLFQQAKQTDRAIEAFQNALTVDPRRLQVLLPLADSLVAAERFDEAITTYRQALAIDPTNVAGHNNLAMVLARQGDPRTAVQHWRTVLQLDPRRLSALVNLAGTLASSPDLQDADEAVRLAERALTLAPSNPQVQAVAAAAQRAAEGSQETDASNRRP